MSSEIIVESSKEKIKKGRPLSKPTIIDHFINHFKEEITEKQFGGLEYWMALNDFEIDTYKLGIRNFLDNGIDIEAFFRSDTKDLKSKLGHKMASIKWELELLHHVDLGAYRKLKNNLLEKGVRIIKYSDEIYPQSLKKAERFCPLVLYHKGTLLNFDNCVAIVGTRNPSSYAREKIRKLSQLLAGKEYTIVSGLALGIDTEAHSGALDVGGKTIAVVPNIGQITPWSNLTLAEAIMRQGAVLGLGSPFSKLSKDKWVKRNKIISGLSKCICVAVSTESKGTYHQVDFAIKQGVKVFALEPLDGDDLEYFAFNKLLDMGAIPFESESEILNYLEGF